MGKAGCVHLYVSYKVDTSLISFSFGLVHTVALTIGYYNTGNVYMPKLKKTFILNISKCIALLPSIQYLKANPNIMNENCKRTWRVFKHWSAPSSPRKKASFLDQYLLVKTLAILF